MCPPPCLTDVPPPVPSLRQDESTNINNLLNIPQIPVPAPTIQIVDAASSQISNHNPFKADSDCAQDVDLNNGQKKEENIEGLPGSQISAHVDPRQSSAVRQISTVQQQYEHR